MYPMLSPYVRALANARTVATLPLQAAAALARGIARRWQGYSDLRRLHEFDDHLLADIGVERDQIVGAIGKAPLLDYRVR